MSTLTRPPYDPELKAALDLMPTRPPLSNDSLPTARTNRFTPPIEKVLDGHEVVVVDHTVTSFDGREIIVSTMQRADHERTDGPAVFSIHGGGMILGDRWVGAEALVKWVETYDAVAATVEYRLAPEHPDPTPIEDCYAALVWFVEHSDELRFDTRHLMVAGGSAGGGLAAGTVLLARDRRGPQIAAQLLMYPMLDDSDTSVSSQQYENIGIWNRNDNRFGWASLLGDRVGTAEVSIYAAPARATDLSGLPPAYLDVGSAEVFRDEVVAYATKIWHDGGEAELHVWNGGFHGYEMIATSALSIVTRAAREAWVRRHLGF
ncbi:alpha/beta hydrolase [Subtercola lobariae]|uniref:Esterase n=1 Tax=Subtercola lobariae TaxID=1588641 RepID=A0A917B1D9_9MICO|nr:alpha/beta hydrolase [Subtercola lobariae]GGF16014.1 esterase [Subtercola lobariae]